METVSVFYCFCPECQDQFPVCVCQVCEAGVRAAGGGGQGLRAGGGPRGHARLLPRQGRRRPQGGLPRLLPRVRVRGGHRGDKLTQSYL